MNLKKKNFNLNIVFEDNYVIVINKNAGIITHSEDNINEFSLVDLLKQNNIVLSKGENNYRPGVVHRLDRDTSGLIIFAKTDSHADDIIQTVREEFGEGNVFCKKLTSRGIASGSNAFSCSAEQMI